MTKAHQIARDYYASPLSNKEIGKKYGVSPNHVKQVADRITPDFAAHPIEDKVVVVVERDKMEAVKHVLKDHEIPFYTPKKFELIEYYESKIN